MKIRFDNEIMKSFFREYPFVIVDVGARGGPKEEWAPLQPYLKYIGFEADPEAHSKLTVLAQKEKEDDTTYYDRALWENQSDLSLYVTDDEGFSSFYLPNHKFLKHFDQDQTAGYTVRQQIPLKTNRLDELLPLPDQKGIDFLKIDVEGGACAVLKGCEKTLHDGVVLGLRIEAEFNQKYENQPLFSDVDQFLRQFPYQLFDMKTCRWKRRGGTKTGGMTGQLVHGDFFYFLDIDSFFEKIRDREEKVSKILKYIVFLCLYGIYDLANELIDEALGNGMLPRGLCQTIQRELTKTRGLLFRIPKLQGRNLFSDLFYHFFMLSVGIWLERTGYWKPSVEL